MKETETVKSENSEQKRHTDDYPKRKGYVWPLILISIGIIFLLNNLGILSWAVWDSIWKFWPLILVFVGINMIFGESGVGSVFVGIFFAVIIFLIVALIVAQYDQGFANWIAEIFPWLKFPNYRVPWQLRGMGPNGF